MAVTQVTLGISTLLLYVPISLAAMHQVHLLVITTTTTNAANNAKRRYLK